MNYKSIALFGVLTSALTTPIAQAAVTDTYVASGTTGQSGYVYTPNVGSASATISVNGTGATQTATLMHFSFSADGYKYWRGNIPVENITSTGINSISVSVNTCDIDPKNGCGQVELNVTADTPANGWVDNGVNTYTNTGYMYLQAGSRTVRFASSTGNVNGIPLNNSRAFMMQGTDVTISVTVGE